MSVSGFETLSENDILGFLISKPRGDNLVRMTIEAGTVVETFFQDDAAGSQESATNLFEAPAIVSLDDPLVLGEPFNRTFMRVGVPEVKLTVFSLTLRSTGFQVVSSAGPTRDVCSGAPECQCHRSGASLLRGSQSVSGGWRRISVGSEGQ